MESNGREKVRVRAIVSAATLVIASVCRAQSIEPVGPAGWTARNWIGLAVQIAVFILAVWGIFRLGGGKDSN